MLYFYNMRYLTFIFLLTCVSCSDRPQLDTMLNDRPEMNIDDTSTIILEKAEKILQAHDWDSTPPEGDKRSEFSFDNKIRIKKGMTPSESWTVFFYESYNIQNREKFEKLYRRAVKGEMTKREWVFENAILEHEAAEKFIIFAEDTLIPYLQDRGLETKNASDYVSFFNLPIEAWMSNDENSYPWNYWGAYYDKYLK